MALDEEIFREATEMIEANLYTTITTQMLAQRLNVSTSTLFRSFQKYTSMGTHRYIRRRKMEKATELLQQGCSVAQTAERLGFCTPGYFSLCYKRETGCYPSQIK